MTDAKATPASLAAMAEEAERKRTAAQEEYRRLSLAAAEGDADAREMLPIFEQDLAALNAELQRLDAAQVEAKTRNAVEALAAETQRAAEQADAVRALVTAQVANVERLDLAVAEMRAALMAMRDGNVALGDALGSEAHQSIHDFNLKLPIMIDTALAIGGFQFKSMPFVARDAEGLPDLAACRLAPLYPAGWLLRVAGAG
ncbi:hypothetical protein [Dongia sedimenti]|uniref:Uncharacterized protein n=1 Tax=Dongia sedimenti TaxID=3064282 RepID=A0ABU0YER6_9PROT|nr:hypothetical protein [Rhodospirillaceae bacterium R-7]